jgi:hypothetical protein
MISTDQFDNLINAVVKSKPHNFLTFKILNDFLIIKNFQNFEVFYIIDNDSNFLYGVNINSLSKKDKNIFLKCITDNIKLNIEKKYVKKINFKTLKNFWLLKINKTENYV